MKAVLKKYYNDLPNLKTLASYVFTILLGNSTIIFINFYIPIIPHSLKYLLVPEFLELEHENFVMKETLSQAYPNVIPDETEVQNFKDQKKLILIILGIIGVLIVSASFLGFLPTPSLAYFQSKITLLLKMLGLSTASQNEILINQISESTQTLTQGNEIIIESNKELIKSLKCLSGYLTAYISKKDTDLVSTSDKPTFGSNVGDFSDINN